MPAKKNTKVRQVNLVPQEDLSSSTSGKVLLWIVSTFRIILIITELFVIGAFISRFWLDAKNTDLSEEMKDKKNIITSLSTFEEDFKDIQNRLMVFDSYKENEGIINENIKTFISYKPDGIIFESISADLDKVVVVANSVSEIELQQYLINLKSEDNFENIKLSGVTMEKYGFALRFTITASVKREL